MDYSGQGRGHGNTVDVSLAYCFARLSSFLKPWPPNVAPPDRQLKRVLQLHAGGSPRSARAAAVEGRAEWEGGYDQESPPT